jgi:N-acetylmuramoyl-L-alanine amidase
VGRRRRRGAHMALTCLLGMMAGCATGEGGPAGLPGSSTAAAESSVSLDVTTSGQGAQSEAPVTAPGTTTASPTAPPPSPSRSPEARPTTVSAVLAAAVEEGSLRGKVVVIDPGHNGGNTSNAAVVKRKVFIGNGMKACDTTGTETNAGYAEHAFNFDVATRLASLLRSAGATVVITRTTNHGIGPCIDRRAAIGNKAHADAAISIHGDGAPAGEHGFHVIVPRGIGVNNAIVTPSRRLGVRVRDAFRSGAGQPLSTYAGKGKGAIVARSDLGGLNLSTVPKVLIECGNMRNAADARRMTSAAWRQQASVALAAGLTAYLTSAS